MSWRPHRGAARTRRAALLTTLAVALALVGASAALASPEKITFGKYTCAPQWVIRNPGKQRFQVVNRSPRKATVYLFSSTSGKIIATIKSLATGHSQLLRAKLTAGVSYSWGCDLRGYPEHVSDSAKTPTSRQYGGPGKSVVPVVRAEMIGPLGRYRSYVSGLEVTLTSQASALTSAIQSGDIASAQAAWLTAHLTWLKIGQDDNAYGAFGELGRKIDGTAAGYPKGIADPGFTGFHKVELELWTKNNLPAAETASKYLQRLIGKLVGESLRNLMPGTDTGITNFTLRAHEILEDALRDTLTADDDYASNTDVATVTADVAATREVLKLLAPVIRPRAPKLVGTAEAQLSKIIKRADASKSDGHWIGIMQLSPAARQQLNASVDAAAATLSRVPDLLQLGNS